MIRIVISGACGKMGRKIAEQALEDAALQITGALEAENSPYTGKDLSEALGLMRRICPVATDAAAVGHVLAGSDCLVEFTNPSVSLAHVLRAAAAHKAVVLGTTGFEKSQIVEIEQAAQKIPIVFSPNMSRGVNLLFKLAEYAAKVLGGDFDAEIVEVHHNKKKDAPSGTALKLAQTIADAKNIDYATHVTFGRSGQDATRKKDDIGVLAVRAGDVVGDHTVIFAGPFERIELTHRAHAREVLAKGALEAAKFIVGKKPGLYSMQDVLGMR